MTAKRKARFRVGQVVKTHCGTEKGSGEWTFFQIETRKLEASGWCYGADGTMAWWPYMERELRPLTRRERGETRR